jgi:PIN domain nuclease of toxin-antitoxin system
MFGEAKLGKKAAKTINLCARGNRLVVSAITPWEIGVLVAKKRINLHQDTMQWVRTAISLPGMTLAPLEPEIAVTSACFPFEMHADPADRILVATAWHLGATLVTADHALLDLAVKGNFRAIDATE